MHHPQHAHRPDVYAAGSIAGEAEVADTSAAALAMPQPTVSSTGGTVDGNVGGTPIGANLLQNCIAVALGALTAGAPEMVVPIMQCFAAHTAAFQPAASSCAAEVVIDPAGQCCIGSWPPAGSMQPADPKPAPESTTAALESSADLIPSALTPARDTHTMSPIADQKVIYLAAGTVPPAPPARFSGGVSVSFSSSTHLFRSWHTQMFSGTQLYPS
jgi:hypothetical protein